MSVAEVSALRSDMAACLRALSGDGAGAEDGAGIEARVAAFIDRANRLHRTFAVAAMRELAAGDSDGDGTETVAALRSEVDALRKELSAKVALLGTHRANVQRWRAECTSVSRAAMAILPDASSAVVESMDALP